MRKIALFFLAACSSFCAVSAKEIKSEPKDEQISSKAAEYQGVDERNKLKMFKLAIQPFEIKSSSLTKGVDADVFQQGLNDAVVAQFTQSRKFRVATRNHQDQKAYEKEISAILDSDSSKERVKLNKKIGADFILTGNILSVTIQQKKTSYYGENFTTWTVSADVAYRMLELATMEVKWSNVIKVNVPANIANEEIDAESKNYSGVINHLEAQIGDTIANQVIGAIYPLQVLKTIDGEIYLNQGGERVKRGSIYEVRQRGGTTIDEATGQHIVLDAKVLAKIKITDVMPKYSIGIVVDGSLSKIQKGARSYLVK